MKKVIAAAFLSLSLSAEVYDGVAIVVKDKPITLYDIKKEMALSKVDAKKASDILIRQKLEELEIQERNIDVTSSEVYDDIKQMAARNGMSISDLYDAVRETNGLSSTAFKEKIKQKLLSQKLYSSIAYSSLSQPSEAEMQEYFEMHKDAYKHPAAFDVVIYDAYEKELLEAKVNNPMFYSEAIATNEQKLPYDRISPELATLLEKTPKGSFTSVIPNGKGGFMSFYVKDIESAEVGGYESVKNQLISAIMEEKRELVLSDYFARLQHNAQIKKLRSVE